RPTARSPPGWPAGRSRRRPSAGRRRTAAREPGTRAIRSPRSEPAASRSGRTWRAAASVARWTAGRWTAERLRPGRRVRRSCVLLDRSGGPVASFPGEGEERLLQGGAADGEAAEGDAGPDERADE